MTKPDDDLDAVRVISTALEPFDQVQREMILRFVRERVGMPLTNGVPGAAGSPPSPPVVDQTTPPTPVPISGKGPTDIKSFMEHKNPKNDIQAVAAVAYFYKFEAPASEHRDAITADEYVNACRLVGRQRPGRAAQTMHNAVRGGLVDAVGDGTFKLNSVGENLVAVVLPGDGSSDATATRKPRRSAKKTSGKAGDKPPRGTRRSR
jgi:hypothetical protein